MREQAIQFGKFKTLVGILHEPETPNSFTTISEQRQAVVLCSSLIYRIGPNRVYVKLARHLASQGLPVLRFDFSGVGDSMPRPDHLPVEEFTIDDVEQAMDYLTERYGMQQFILIGHCAGGYHSIRTAKKDTRVQVAIMINPDSRDDEWAEYDRKRKLARYYENYSKKTLLNANSWKRFFIGRVNYANIIRNLILNVLWNHVSGLFFKLRWRFKSQSSHLQADQSLFTIESIIQQLFNLETRVLLIYIKGSSSLERVQMNMGKALKELEAQGKLELITIPNADHLFTTTDSQKQLIKTVTTWLKGHQREERKETT